MIVVEYDPTKLDAKKRGLFPRVRVFTNGTVRLQIAPHVKEIFNIRKIWPYREPSRLNYLESWKETL